MYPCIIFILSYQLKLTSARLKKGTTQWFRLANSARIYINLSWYDYTIYLGWTLDKNEEAVKVIVMESSTQESLIHGIGLGSGVE